MPGTEPPTFLWRSDLDALQFDLVDGAGQCLVHRLAFRALLAQPPSQEACEAYFRQNSAAFEAAALDKANRRGLAPGSRFHLTSRDIANSASPRREDRPVN